VAVKSAVWNLAGSLANEANAGPLVDYIKELNVDFAAFPEAFNEGDQAGLDEAEELLRGLGYSVASALYDDADKTRTDRRGILAISRLGDVKPVSLGTRNALLATMTDPATNIVIASLGGHFDDRKEDNRQGQAHAALSVMPKDMPGMMSLDANAMHRKDPRSRIYRSVGPLVRRLPAHPPTIGQNEKKLTVMVSKAQRIAEMANGGTLRILEEAGYQDVTRLGWRGYKPTAKFIGGLASAQLDHIMVEHEWLHANNPEIIHVPEDKGADTEHALVRTEVGVRSALVMAKIES
jgi:hypothetical protein